MRITHYHTAIEPLGFRWVGVATFIDDEDEVRMVQTTRPFVSRETCQERLVAGAESLLAVLRPKAAGRSR